jgi:hypothetical protein
MLMFGNLMRVSGVVKRLTETAANPLMDIVTIFLGLSVGASMQAHIFLTYKPLMVFGLGRRTLSSLAGVAAAAVFAILSVGTSFLGPFGHATHFVLLPVLGGLILLDRALASGRGWTFFAAGVCLGLSVLMKQPGAVFALFALGWWG